LADPLFDRFATLISATPTYESAIEACYVDTGTLTGCGAGANGVPADYSGTGSVASVVASTSGVVTLTPAATGGILSSDTYVRTPTVNPPESGPRLAQDITWATSGGACVRSLALC
jgi:type IV pilus assembly protein PilA